MMEWSPRCFDDLVPLLDRLLAELESVPLRLTPREILEALSGDASSDEIDAACRLLAKTGTVPDGLPDSIKWQLACRVRCCRWYCHDQTGMSAMGESAGHLLLSLLIEYWDDVGRFDWIQEDLLAGDYQQS
jgi:hypothetical protein